MVRKGDFHQASIRKPMRKNLNWRLGFYRIWGMLSLAWVLAIIFVWLASYMPNVEFDLKGARDAGYSDTEIATYLSKQNKGGRYRLLDTPPLADEAIELLKETEIDQNKQILFGLFLVLICPPLLLGLFFKALAWIFSGFIQSQAK